MWRLGIVYLACLGSFCASQQPCPSFSSLNPPSGLVSVPYVITGENLDAVADVTATKPTAFGELTLTYAVLHPDAIQINFTASGVFFSTLPVTVTLSPANATACNDVVIPDVLVYTQYPAISSTTSSSGQPGTNIHFQGCFPPACGDNSTYMVRVGGVDVTNVQNDFSDSIIRLVEIPSPMLGAQIEIVSEYAEYVLAGTLSRLDYLLAGNISSVSPGMGQLGTRVTIKGQNLIGLGAGVTLDRVQLGNASGGIVQSSQGQLTVRAPTGVPGQVDIRINSTQTLAVDTVLYTLNGPYNYLQDGWRQLADGNITDIIPPATQEGSVIFLCGNNLLGGGSNVTEVSILGSESADFSTVLAPPIPGLMAPECINATVPAPPLSESSPQEGGVRLTSDTQAIVQTQGEVLFRYASITSVDPNEGQEFTRVNITGFHLLSGYSESEVIPEVYLSGVKGIVTSYSPTEIVVLASPPNSVNVTGNVTIEVTNFNITSVVSLFGAWTYRNSGRIEDVTPSFGQYGTYVTITGTNLLGYATGLEKATVTATGGSPVLAQVISSSPSEVILEIPMPSNPGYVGNASLELTSENGAQIIGADVFEYRVMGEVTDVFPSSGQNGTRVTIMGTNLFGHGNNVSSVRLGGVDAQVISVNTSLNTSLSVRAGPLNVSVNTPVHVTVIADTQAKVQSASPIWTYLPPGSITSIVPSQGQFGSTITITGTNLLGGGTSIAQIFMDGIVPTVQSFTSEQILLRLGDENTRDPEFFPGQVFIEANLGSIVIGGPFQQLSPGMITSFSPTVGRLGTVIEIYGYNLTGFGLSINSVEIAGYPGLMADAYQSQDGDTRLTIQAGNGVFNSSGPIRLLIDTGAVVESSSSFTYLERGNITSLSQSSGAEGLGLLIKGLYLQAGGVPISNVTIGGAEVTKIVTRSETDVSVIVGPPPLQGLADLVVRVTSSDGSFVTGGVFTYQNFTLTVLGLDRGQLGTVIRLNLSSSLDEIARVYVDDQEASILSKELFINVSVPRARQVGEYPVDVAVERVDGLIVRLDDGFTYINEGAIYDIIPPEGQRGTSVVVLGQNLLGGGNYIASASFGSQIITVGNSSDTSVELSIPTNPANVDSLPAVVDIVLVSDTGALVQRLSSFTLVEPGNITSVFPPEGQFGTLVTIQGTNLLQGSLALHYVSLAGILADMVGTPSNTLITVRASSSPVATTGQVDLVLSTGALIQSTIDNYFTYISPGSIMTVNPSSGTNGTVVNITGTNLLGGGKSVVRVTLDGVEAAIEGNYSNETIIVTAGASNVFGGPAGKVEIVSDTQAVVAANGSWTYVPPGIITSVSPQSGQQGVEVAIEGVGLLGGSGSSITSVFLAGVPALVVNSSNTTVHVVAGYSPHASVGIVVLYVDNGPVVESGGNQTWSYYAASLDSVSPSSGLNGTYVTLTGTNLVGEPGSVHTIDSITLSGVPAFDVMILSPNSIIVRAGYLSVDNGMTSVRITSTSGTYLEAYNTWQYAGNGFIVSVQPPSAPPGRKVIITGSNLVPNGSTGVTVVIGQTEAYNSTVINSSAVSFRVGVYEGLDSPNTALPILIVADDGSTVYNSSGLFTIESSFAAVDGIYPVAGGTGSTVQINGMFPTNATNGSSVSVYLAGVQAEVLNYTSTYVTVRAGASSNQSGSIVIELDANGLLAGLSGDAWTYLPSITASSVFPQGGRNGTVVTIDVFTIPDSYTPTAVLLAGVMSEIQSLVNGTVSVVAGYSNSTPTSDITIEFMDGILLTIANSWSYQSPVAIDSTSDQLVGYYSSIITISGSGFMGQAGVNVISVSLAGLSTSIQMQDDTQLVVRVADSVDSAGGNFTGPVIILSEDGATFTSGNSIFTYLQVSPEMLYPTHGQSGTRVKLNGTGLLAGGSNITSFSMDGLNSTIESYSDTEIIVSAPFSPTQTGLVNVTYTVDTGAQISVPYSWSFVAPGEIESVTPSLGSFGTVVTIAGSSMLGGGMSATRVLLDEVEAREILIANNDVIQVTAGEMIDDTPGTIHIVANTGAVVESTPLQVTFQYLQPGAVTLTAPSFGQRGTVVTILGERFDNGEGVEEVMLAGVPANIISSSSTNVTVAAQRPSIPGSFSGPVTIVSNFGSITQSTENFNFAYVEEGQILSISPPQGQVGTRIILRGMGLLGGDSVLRSASLAGTDAAIVSANNTVVVLIAGENNNSLAMPVVGDILLTAVGGAQVIRVNSWTYVRFGSVASLVPSAGQYGTQVNISGENLLAGGTTVQELYVGDIAALEIVYSSSSLVSFRAGEPPDNLSRNGTITIVSNDGGNLTTNAVWMYKEPGKIVEVIPNNGTGGTTVNITGVNLLGGGSSLFSLQTDGVEALHVLQVFDSFIEFEVGFNLNGLQRTGDVIIVSDSGAIVVAGNGWTYSEECSLGTYRNDTDSCAACNSQCVHCFGPTEFDCFQCSNFRVETANGTQCVITCPGPNLSTLDKMCVAACETNQYKQTLFDNVTYCLNCSEQCDSRFSCDGPSSSTFDCSACASVSYNYTCISSCPEGTFTNSSGVCSDCDSNCLPEAGCSGPQPSECNMCRNVTNLLGECVSSCLPLEYVDDQNRCQPCNPLCSDGCFGPLSSQCFSCANASIQYENGTSVCVQTCNTSPDKLLSYEDVRTGVCHICSPACSVKDGCFGPSAADCVTCRNFTGSNTNASQLYLRNDGECVAVCPDNKYANLASGECVPCHSSCLNGCTGGTAEDCNDDEAAPPGPFSAGAGTIVLVVLVIIAIIIAAVVVIIVMVVVSRRRSKYNIGLENNYTKPDLQMKEIRRKSITETKINPVFEEGSATEVNATMDEPPEKPSQISNSKLQKTSSSAAVSQSSAESKDKETPLQETKASKDTENAPEIPPSSSSAPVPARPPPPRPPPSSADSKPPPPLPPPSSAASKPPAPLPPPELPSKPPSHLPEHIQASYVELTATSAHEAITNAAASQEDYVEMAVDPPAPVENAGPEDNYEEATSLLPTFDSPDANYDNQDGGIVSPADDMYEDTEMLAEDVKQQLQSGVISSSLVLELCSQDEMYEDTADASFSAAQYRKTSGPPLPPKGSNTAPALPSRPNPSKRSSRGALPLPPKSSSSSRLSDSFMENPENFSEDLYEAIPGHQPVTKPRSGRKFPWKK